MRAVVARGGAALGLEDVPRPEPGPGQVRVSVGACGICGSDLTLRGVGAYPPGLIPGHEFAGTVEALGPDVEGVSEGDRVAVEPFSSCGACAECRNGWDPLCSEGKLLGIHMPGGMAESVVADARRLFRAPQALAPEVLAMAEPLAVSLHGLRRGGLTRGSRVLIVGAGAVGQLAAFAAHKLGAGEVWVTARHAHQARQALALGAHRVLSETEASREALASLGREAPIDLAVETVGGTADTLNDAAAAVRPGGTVAVLGVWMAPVALDTMPLLLKEVSLVWSYCYHHAHGPRREAEATPSAPGRVAEFAEAVAMLAEEPDRIGALLSHRVPLAEAPSAFDLAADKRAGAVKVSVVV